MHDFKLKLNGVGDDLFTIVADSDMHPLIQKAIVIIFFRMLEPALFSRNGSYHVRALSHTNTQALSEIRALLAGNTEMLKRSLDPNNTMINKVVITADNDNLTKHIKINITIVLLDITTLKATVIYE